MASRGPVTIAEYPEEKNQPDDESLFQQALVAQKSGGTLDLGKIKLKSEHNSLLGKRAARSKSIGRIYSKAQVQEERKSQFNDYQHDISNLGEKELLSTMASSGKRLKIDSRPQKSILKNFNYTAKTNGSIVSITSHSNSESPQKGVDAKSTAKSTRRIFRRAREKSNRKRSKSTKGYIYRQSSNLLALENPSAESYDKIIAGLTSKRKRQMRALNRTRGDHSAEAQQYKKDLKSEIQKLSSKIARYEKKRERAKKEEEEASRDSYSFDSDDSSSDLEFPIKINNGHIHQATIPGNRSIKDRSEDYGLNLLTVEDLCKRRAAQVANNQFLDDFRFQKSIRNDSGSLFYKSVLKSLKTMDWVSTSHRKPRKKPTFDVGGKLVNSGNPQFGEQDSAVNTVSVCSMVNVFLTELGGRGYKISEFAKELNEFYQSKVEEFVFEAVRKRLPFSKMKELDEFKRKNDSAVCKN